MQSECQSPFYVLDLSLISISFCGLLSVIIYLFFMRIRSLLLLAISYLFLTQTLQIIFTLPILSVNDKLCKASAFLSNYFGVANVVITAIITYCFLLYLFTDDWSDNSIIIPKSRRAVSAVSFLLVSIPLITALPFITNSYDKVVVDCISWSVFLFFINHILIFIIIIIMAGVPSSMTMLV